MQNKIKKILESFKMQSLKNKMKFKKRKLISRKFYFDFSKCLYFHIKIIKISLKTYTINVKFPCYSPQLLLLFQKFKIKIKFFNDVYLVITFGNLISSN